MPGPADAEAPPPPSAPFRAQHGEDRLLAEHFRGRGAGYYALNHALKQALLRARILR